MQETAVVVLKSGHKIEIPVTSVAEFAKAITGSINPKVPNNYYYEGPVVINFAEVAAIHPKGWEAKEPPCER